VARALEARQFQLFLQPQVELPSRRLVGAEALLRWNRDGKKSASPPDILQVLERIGLMGELSRWVIQQAAQVLATLADAGCDVAISVNLVADDLKDPELPCSSVKPAKPGGCRYPGCVSNSPRVAWYRGMACR
jgi:EAL domain-containing protein (putative c-di-GMP-specific phosphodiesterase class I)